MTDRDNRSLDCPHRATCGACSLLNVAYGAQLERKRRWLGDTLRQRLRLAPGVLLPTLPSPRIEGYRNRAKMAIATDRAGRSDLGYFQRRSRTVVDAPDCRVLVPELLETTRRLRQLLNSSHRFPFELRHLDLRCGSDPTRQHLTLVVRSDTMPRLPIQAIVEACPRVTGVAVNLNPGKGPQVIKGHIEPLFGAREVFVSSGGLSLRVSPGSFFQVNLGVLAGIHDRIGGFLGRGGLLVDLYAGVGTHGLALRRSFRRVLCVEGVRAAVADARASIEHARVDNVEVLAGPVHRALRRLRAERPDAVILNPSATGAEPAVLEAITASSARAVAYLSCDPATLTRDLASLVEAGFEPFSIQPIDMMPQTSQVEALALLRR